jgi:hypothetical protein
MVVMDHLLAKLMSHQQIQTLQHLGLQHVQ